MTKAIILAAGRGTRLVPYTDHLPKCLLKIGSKTILEHQLAILGSNGVDEIFIVVGHYKDKIVEVVGNRAKFIENKDYRTTNSTYSLWLARKYLKDGFIYLNSDLIFHPGLLKKLLDSEHENAMIVDKSKKLEDGMFKAVIKDNKVVRLGKDINLEIAHGDAPGPLKISSQFAKKVFEEIKENVKKGDKGQWCYTIFGKVAASEPLFAIDAAGYYWTKIDNIKDLNKARELAEKWKKENMI